MSAHHVRTGQEPGKALRDEGGAGWGTERAGRWAVRRDRAPQTQVAEKDVGMQMVEEVGVVRRTGVVGRREGGVRARMGR